MQITVRIEKLSRLRLKNFLRIKISRLLWSLVSGLWSLVSGLWSLVSGLWSLVFGLVSGRSHSFCGDVFTLLTSEVFRLIALHSTQL